MTIDDIKRNLSIQTVLNHYNLSPERNNRLKCPFHDDKTPSLQIYPKTNTAYCFSTNCQTHSLSRASGSKSIDVIDFIMYIEKCTKHEAIEKAKHLIQGSQPAKIKKDLMTQPNDEERIALLEKLFPYFKSSVQNSKPARDYIKSRELDYTKTEIGYNSGQFHRRLNGDKDKNEVHRINAYLTS